MMDRLKRTELNHLTRKQRECIPHLIGAKSLEEGRLKAKVSKATLFKWLKEDTFKAELDRQREIVISEALDRLKASLSKAVDELAGLIDADEKNIKIRACERVIEYFMKTKELSEIEARLNTLEKALAERGHNHKRGF
jgi:hypothetical protein